MFVPCERQQMHSQRLEATDVLYQLTWVLSSTSAAV